MNKVHIKFLLRKDRAKSNGLSPIYMYANINGKVKHFSLNHAVNTKAWNEKKQEVSVTFPNWNTINDDIARYRSKAEKMRIAADDADEMISLYRFEKVFRGGARNLKDIFSFIKDDIKEFGNTYAPATIKMYESQSRKLKRFRDNLKFHEITPLFWKEYNSHLIAVKNNDNTRWKSFRTIKTYINKAIENGILTTDPLRGVKVKKPEGNRMHLTKEEVNSLEKLFGSNLREDLKNVLRYFLFSCFTGLRYIDVKRLLHSNLFLERENPYLRIVQHKTSKPLILPLGEKALTYVPIKGLPRMPVFKVYTNQVTNKLLKEIMKLAEINKSISFHCARHTFSVLALELSHDIAGVSNLLGHSSIKTTQLYAKVQESSKKGIIALMDTM
jgi:site-specific recombinase XerD